MSSNQVRRHGKEDSAYKVLRGESPVIAYLVVLNYTKAQTQIQFGEGGVRQLKAWLEGTQILDAKLGKQVWVHP